MDRMNFIPGASKREAIENANGTIIIDYNHCLWYADEFLTNFPILYQAVLACLSNGDIIRINFGLTDSQTLEDKDPSGELIGHTWATLIEADGRERLLWEVGRRTTPLRQRDVVNAFNAYTLNLATYQGAPPPLPFPVPEATTLPGVKDISRALSPSHLYFVSSTMWCFIDLSGAAPSRPEDAMKPFMMSRPMCTIDALCLSSLVTLAIGAPPLVFGVLQKANFVGRIPDGFISVSYALDPSVVVDDGKVVLIG